MSELRGTFLGVSTILLDDGDTAILTDGFFSRPGLARVMFGRLRPDRDRISSALRRFGIDRDGGRARQLPNRVVALVVRRQVLGHGTGASHAVYGPVNRR